MNEDSGVLAIASAFPEPVTALRNPMAWTAYRQLMHENCGLSRFQEPKTTRQWPWHSYRGYAGQKSPSQAPQSHHGLSRIPAHQAQANAVSPDETLKEDSRPIQSPAPPILSCIMASVPQLFQGEITIGFRKEDANQCRSRASVSRQQCTVT
jgi:hypothetical protein